MPVDVREAFRPSRPIDVPELGRLFREVFGHERDERIWRWKFFDNPRGSFSYVAEAEGRLVAHCAGTAVQVRDGATRYLALQSVDFMSTPNYPGGIGRGGVFARLVQSFFAEYCGIENGPQLVYGFPGERHRVLGEKILGYSSIEAVGEYSLLASGKGGSFVTEPLEPFLALLSQAPRRFGAIRDETYVRWRYRDHPLHRYSALPISRWPWRKPQLIAVVRETEEEVMLLEIEGDDSSANLARLVERLERSGKRCWGWGAPSHRATGRLLEAGFKLQQRPHRFEVRLFLPRPIPSPGELYYSLGDYDVF